MALLIKANGETEIIRPTSGPAFTLKELQTIIGGYIEAVHVEVEMLMLDETASYTRMVVDEEGKLKDLPLNPIATTIHGNPYDRVVGPALFCTDKEFV